MSSITLDKINLQSRYDSGLKNSSSLKELFQQAVAGSCGHDCLINDLAKTYSLEEIQEQVQKDFQTHKDAFGIAQDLFHEAKYYLDAAKNLSPSLAIQITLLLDALKIALGNILSSIGLADFFKPAENSFHADMKMQKLMMQTYLLSSLTVLLTPLLGPAAAGMVLGGVFLAINGLSFIYPYICPAASSLPAAENWTLACLEGYLPCPEGRKEVVDAIAQTLIAGKTTKMHPILLGKTGVGKTEAVKALVHAIERGDYPDLKGKKIFYINTANLVHSAATFSTANQSLERISDAMGRHREKFILVLDEIHLACQVKKETGLGDQLKTVLDSGKKGFPYVIGITTEEEFYRDIYLEHAAFARRFKQISIVNTEDPQTLKILHHFLIQQAPHIRLSPDAMQVLLDKTKTAFGEDAAQPGTALQILAQCLKKMDFSEKSSTQHQVEQVQHQIQAIYSQRAALIGESLLPYDHNHEMVVKLTKELDELLEKLQKEQVDIDHLRLLQKELASIKTSAFKTAVKISCQSKLFFFFRKEEVLKKFLLQTHFLAPAIEKKIQMLGDRLGLPTVIDASLIDAVIQSEQAGKQKAIRLIEQGKQQLKARAT